MLCLLLYIYIMEVNNETIDIEKRANQLKIEGKKN